MVNWTHTLGYNRKINPLPTNDPVCAPEDIHIFGQHSGLCNYCGIARGWFSQHEGKICNARKALRKLQQEKSLEKEQQATVAKAKALLSGGADDSGLICTIQPDSELPIQPKPQKKARVTTGRRFR